MEKLLLTILLAWLAWYFLIGPGRTRSKSSDTRTRTDRTLAAELAEARALLGVGDDADAAAIRAAHRRLVSAVHPDKGGSAELTRRINAARDLLLRH